jgi:hypothetical protein
MGDIECGYTDFNELMVKSYGRDTADRGNRWGLWMERLRGIKDWIFDVLSTPDATATIIPEKIEPARPLLHTTYPK